jgi:hypothetical protein
VKHPAHLLVELLVPVVDVVDLGVFVVVLLPLALAHATDVSDTATLLYCTAATLPTPQHHTT